MRDGGSDVVEYAVFRKHSYNTTPSEFRSDGWPQMGEEEFDVSCLDDS